MMMTCNTRVTTLSINTHCTENKSGMWMVCGSDGGQHLTTTCLLQEVLRGASSTLSQSSRTQKQFFKLTLRDPHLLEIKLSLQPSLVADSSPHHGTPLMMNCSWLKTQDTRIIKTESNIACLVSICSRAMCACTPLRNDEFTNTICVGLSDHHVHFFVCEILTQSSFSCGETHLY